MNTKNLVGTVILCLLPFVTPVHAGNEHVVGVASLGVTVSDPTYAERRELDLPNGGAVVREVDSTGRAFDAGMHTGDVIVAFDQVPIDSIQHLSDLVEEVPADKPLPVLLLRGQGRFVAVVLPAKH